MLLHYLDIQVLLKVRNMSLVVVAEAAEPTVAVAAAEVAEASQEVLAVVTQVQVQVVQMECLVEALFLEAHIALAVAEEAMVKMAQ